MAIATTTNISVPQPVVYKYEKHIVLTLDPKEAELLCYILNYVGGNPSSNRGVVDGIRSALVSAGVKPAGTFSRDLHVNKEYGGPRGGIDLI